MSKFKTKRAVEIAILHMLSQTITTLANDKHLYLTQLIRLKKLLLKMLNESETKHTDEAWLKELELAEERLTICLDNI